GTKLSAKGRPPEVAWWIGRGRKQKPTVQDVKKFETQWNAWWRALNPDWRRRDDEGMEMRKEEGGDWTELLVSGTNGMMHLLMPDFPSN
ncbi:hypothetical protein FB451DRAFT_1053687, partial [Mycena latifolia]